LKVDATRPVPDAPGGELERCLRDPGYTPPRRALGALIAGLAGLGEEEAKAVERALARAGAPAVDALLEAFGSEPREPALLRFCERLASETRDRRLFEPLVAALSAPQPHCPKLAARALGKLQDERAEEPLLAALGRAADGPERKSIIDALGALGSERSLKALELVTAGDADLLRRVKRASLSIERRRVRELPAQISFDAPLEAPWTIELSCRAGLSGVLASELGGSFAPSVHGPGAVRLEHRGTLGELLAARTALELACVVPLVSGASDPAERIAEALTRPATLSIFERWTRGLPRFRIAWTASGHRRSLTWAVASAVRRRETALLNDSRQALWTVRAAPDASGELRLVPRLDPDPRFAYRLGAVRAASHPTVAAALARVAAARGDDVVWDPFVGSGLELAELARLGSVRELWGSDLDAGALEVARANLAAAGVAGVRLRQADALAWAPDGVSLIVTNPPMGRRLARDGSLDALLTGFVRHAARVLRPGGRLVWLSPLAAKTERAAREAGLAVTLGPDVDMGGFTAKLQTIRRV